VYNQQLPGDLRNPQFGYEGDLVVKKANHTGEAEIENIDEELLASHVVRLNANVLGIVLGILFGLIIFLATNFLLLKGGKVIGPHLGLLGQFFIGYSVSFIGSLVGFIYAFVCGYIAGFVIGWIYNKVAVFKNRHGQ
jgi:hypothetical protein